MTRRAMQFLEEDDGEQPWLPPPELHQAALALHRACALQRHVLGGGRSGLCTALIQERENTNPLAQHFQERICGRTFSKEEARETVIPAYMGLDQADR